MTMNDEKLRESIEIDDSQHCDKWTDVFIMGSNYTDTGEINDNDENFPFLKCTVVVILSLFCLGGVFGNILVCLAVCKIRSLQVVGNYFVVSLAVADVLVSGLVMPVAISFEFLDGKWIFGQVICYAWTFLDVALSTASIINLGAISVDRYRAVTQPLTYASKRTASMARKVIIIVWVVSLIVGAPATIFINYTDNECFFNENARYYSIISSCLSFYIPCFIILVLYYQIFKTAQFRATRRIGPAIASVAAMYPKVKVPEVERDNSNGQPSSSEAQSGTQELNQTCTTCPNEVSQNQATKEKHDNRRGILAPPSENNVLKSQKRISVAKERKAAVVLMIVVGTFVACWLPFFTLNVVGALCASCNFGPRVMSVVVWLGWCNSIVNPALYTVFNKEFRNAFKKLLHIDRPFVA